MNLNTYEIEVERTVIYSGAYRIEAETRELAEEYFRAHFHIEPANFLIKEECDSEEIELKSVKFISR